MAVSEVAVAMEDSKVAVAMDSEAILVMATVVMEAEFIKLLELATVMMEAEFIKLLEMVMAGLILVWVQALTGVVSVEVDMAAVVTVVPAVREAVLKVVIVEEDLALVLADLALDMEEV